MCHDGQKLCVRVCATKSLLFSLFCQWQQDDQPVRCDSYPKAKSIPKSQFSRARSSLHPRPREREGSVRKNQYCIGIAIVSQTANESDTHAHTHTHTGWRRHTTPQRKQSPGQRAVCMSRQPRCGRFDESKPWQPRGGLKISASVLKGEKGVCGFSCDSYGAPPCPMSQNAQMSRPATGDEGKELRHLQRSADKLEKESQHNVRDWAKKPISPRRDGPRVKEGSVYLFR
ncbi:hypothetical protein B0T26DRAFT_29597 [Lasiosphaeria miniovina]|uniref:Uncharacterized protein n=1 Tax=Lasiosphaeria miniovina TaxID=1954250 RepID=A0AA40BG43_9PEZI|nr:uncharacterized protein B0T26DRAFT_29597 [Lasiosphaeria miniovina]KAK0733618.1 hypothetical protein B0T26DRAFT_29597 [Lasiosphaeria miniovina]